MRSLDLGDGNNASWERQRDLPPIRISFAALVLTLLAVLAYVNTVFHPFQYDDLPLVLRNPWIRSLSNIPRLMGFGDHGFVARPRFTRDVTYAIEYSIAGPRPPLYHVSNILLHACAGIVLFLLVSRLARDRWLGGLTAALFVLHPIGTDVVAQISGRREILATLFCLAVALFLQAHRERGGAWRVGAAGICLYLGVFSKEMAVMAPLAFFCIEALAPVGRVEDERSGPPGIGSAIRRLLSTARMRFGAYAGLAAVMAAAAAARFFLSNDPAGIGGSPSFYETSGTGLTLLDRARIAGLGLRLLLVPVGQSLDYSYDALGLVRSGFSLIAAVDVAILAGAVLVACLGIRSRSFVGAGAAWYVLFYLPTSGIIPWHEIFAERFLYLPSIGFYLASASILVKALRSRRLSRTTMVGVAVLLTALAAATVRRNEAWASPESVWRSAVDRYPSCARAHKALADQYRVTGRLDEALEHYRQAVRILPAYRDAHVGVGAALMALGRTQEAVSAFQAVLHRWPEDPKTLNDLGMLYENRGEQDRAIDLYQRATRSGPELAEPYNNMGRIYAIRGDFQAAVRMYESALDRDPALLPALRNLATTYRHMMRDEKTAEVYEEKARQLIDAR